MSIEAPGPRAENLPAHQARQVLRAYVLTYTRDRLGREASDRSRFAALDALDVLDREGD